MVVIYPYQLTQVGGFNSPYTNVNASNAFTYPLTVTYPECTSSGPFNVPAVPLGMSCSLYRADTSVLVTALSNCSTIGAGLMTNGLNYFVAYVYRTTPTSLLSTVSG